MAFYKVYLTLSILCVSTCGFKALANPLEKPWTNIERAYEFSSTDNSPIYANFPRTSEEIRRSDSTINLDEPKEFSSSASSARKKSPKGNKYFKKSVSPFYTITDKDPENYKTAILKSGVPYCEEVKIHRDSSKKEIKICYKCKNPKTGSTEEQCSYGSQPSKRSDSMKFEDYEVPAASFRSRRSNSDESNYKSNDDYEKHGSPYRFSDKIFEESTEDFPAKYKNEKCEKIIKNSMVCMVCTDEKTNGKYEQCSYVRQPNEKSFKYTKSSSFENPEKLKTGKNRSKANYSDTKPVREEEDTSESYESSPREEYRQESQERKSEEETSENCEKVEKDTKTCMVCKDPKTGSNYEKCSYAFQPNDKIYKFTRSKSFGYPRDSSSKKSEEPKFSGTGKGESSEYKKDYSIPASFHVDSDSFYNDKPSSGYREAPAESTSEEEGATPLKLHSERALEKNENCRKVEKNSMICNVCKDPESGNTSEQCSYNYKPDDRLYSYSKSRSIGSPTEDEESSSASEKLEKNPESSPFEGTYDFAPEKKPQNAARSSREFRETPTSTSKFDADSEEATTKKPVDFYDAFKKKAEIEKYLKEFKKEDRSNCKKIMKDQMICYQCTDRKGFRKEECAFTTDDQPDKIAYRELKEFKDEEMGKKVPRSTSIDDSLPVDSDASASEDVEEKHRKPVREEVEEFEPEEETSKGVEPYESVDETRPIFDKILGMTLPAYMLETSEHERDFDKTASSSRI